MPSYPGLSSEAFRHPLDRDAERALRNLPGFDLVARKFLEVVVDRPQQVFYLGNAVRVGPRQYASVYHLFRETLRDLDVYPEPALFVSQSPQVNAYTIGQEQPTLVLTSGLLDLMQERELRSVLAHEIGHLKCGHATLSQMAMWAIYAASILGELTLGLGNLLIGNALIFAFYEWKRKAELSSDRAALLALDDLDAVAQSMLLVAGGSSQHRQELSLAEFKQQAADYAALDNDGTNQVYKFLLYNNLSQQIFISHPFPVERLSHLQTWAASEEYQRIRSGDYPRNEAQGSVEVATNGTNTAAESERDRLRRQIDSLQQEIDRLKPPGS